MAIIFLRPPSWQQSLGSVPEASPNLDASRAGIRLAWKNVSGLEFGVRFVSCFPYVVGRVMIFKRSHAFIHSLQAPNPPRPLKRQ